MKKYIILASLCAVAIGAQMVSARISNPPAAGLSALTPWSESIDGGGYSLSNVLTGAFTNLTSTNATSTGTLAIPTSATLTTPIGGNVGIDTTSGQIRYSDVTGTTKVASNGNIYAGFTYATSTAWTATTTIPLGTARVGETWNDVQCYTDVGTLDVNFYDGTNRMNWIIGASTTVGTIPLTTNNTFTSAEKRYVDIGNPTSSPAKISCTVSKSIQAD